MPDPAVDLSAGAPDPADAPEAPLGSPWSDLRAYVALPRLTDLALAPDGSHLVASVSALNNDRNAYVTSLWRIDPAGEAEPRRLTRGVDGEGLAAFCRDGSLLFTAKRPVPAEGEDAVSETTKALWCLPAAGGEAYAVARRDGGWNGLLTSKDADTVVFAAPTHEGVADEKADAAKRAQRGKDKVTAIVHADNPVRFWDHDLGPEFDRVLASSLDTSGVDVKLGDVRALSGDTGRRLGGLCDVTRDGRILATGWMLDRGRGRKGDAVALWNIETGERRMLESSEYDYWGATFAPDGHSFVTTAVTQGTPQRCWQQFLAVVDSETLAVRELAREWDREGHPACFSPDGSVLYVTADDDGQAPIFAIDVASGAVRRLTDEGAFAHVSISPDGHTLYALRSSYTDPGSIVAVDAASGAVRALKAPVEYPELPGRLERVETVRDGVRVPGYLITPEGANAAVPAKLALWVHGGPLGSWNAWSWRWCPWLLVSQGYAVLLPDPALSRGYGQEYLQRGWGEWGTQVFGDVMALTDAACERPDIDETRQVMMGGSFGGYMANWIAGHTGDRFKAIVSHASLWNLDSFGQATDAPWFWDLEIAADKRAEQSPHRYASQIEAPMLVIHGDRDYRVPIGEGLGLWWALVSNFDGPADELPHRFLYYPNENHWVLTPNHARVWYETVRNFLAWHVDGAPDVRSELL